MLFRSLSVHIPRRDASFRNSLANGQGLADEEGMRRTTSSREDCLRVEGREGDFLSSGTGGDRSEGHPNATRFSDISGIREVELGWGLTLEKERRKAGWPHKGKEHPSVLALEFGWTDSMSFYGSVGGGSERCSISACLVWPG